MKQVLKGLNSSTRALRFKSQMFNPNTGYLAANFSRDHFWDSIYVIITYSAIITPSAEYLKDPLNVYALPGMPDSREVLCVFFLPFGCLFHPDPRCFFNTFSLLAIHNLTPLPPLSCESPTPSGNNTQPDTVVDKGLTSPVIASSFTTYTTSLI